MLENTCISKRLLLMQASDGPNVNMKAWQIMNDGIKDIRGKSLVDLGILEDLDL